MCFSLCPTLRGLYLRWPNPLTCESNCQLIFFNIKDFIQKVSIVAFVSLAKLLKDTLFDAFFVKQFFFHFIATIQRKISFC